jgi:hypothetical protein
MESRADRYFDCGAGLAILAWSRRSGLSRPQTDPDEENPMLKIAPAFVLALALVAGPAVAQSNGSSGNGQNWFERCSPETISEIAAAVNDLSDANPRKAALSTQAKSCMLRLSAAMQKIR